MENGFPALKRDANSSWKSLNIELLLLKKHQKLLNSQFFFFMRAVCTAILGSHWKKFIIPYLQYPKFKQ